MDEMERQLKDYAEGKCEKNPVRNVEVNGQRMQVQIVMNAGGLSGDEKWRNYTINVIKAAYADRLLTYDEVHVKKVSTNKGRASAARENAENPLPDFCEGGMSAAVPHGI